MRVILSEPTNSNDGRDSTVEMMICGECNRLDRTTPDAEIRKAQIELARQEVENREELQGSEYSDWKQDQYRKLVRKQKRDYKRALKEGLPGVDGCLIVNGQVIPGIG